jgi:sulfate transport system substrate-binding protein
MSIRAGLTAALTALAAVVAIAAGCVAGEGDRLSLVAYSTPREAYEELVSLFGDTPEGDGVRIAQSYGSSAEQARTVLAGLRADVVALALAPDMDTLVEKGLVDAGWRSARHGGMVTESVVVFVVREGNPKGIRDWDDLLRPGVGVLTPNPFTSGGARWNVMAAYGAWRKAGLSDEEAQGRLRALFENVVVQDRSARDSLNTFSSGKGDVLLAYENEALFARAKGEDLPFVVPRSTILIENPVAVTTETRDLELAGAFLEYLWTAEAQQIFADHGYRPVHDGVLEANRERFPPVSGLFTIDDLGGWAEVQERFFDPRSGIMARIEREVGSASG